MMAELEFDEMDATKGTFKNCSDRKVNRCAFVKHGNEIETDSQCCRRFAGIESVDLQRLTVGVV